MAADNRPNRQGDSEEVLDLGFGPAEEPARAGEPRLELSSLFADEYSDRPWQPRPGPTATEEQEPGSSTEPSLGFRIEGLESSVRDLKEQVEAIERRLSSVWDRLSAIEQHSRAAAEISHEVADTLRQIRKGRPAAGS
jgi:hypothetical protein